MAGACFIAGLFVLLILLSTFLSNKAYKNGMKVKKVLLVQVASFLVSLFTCSALAMATSQQDKPKVETVKNERVVESESENTDAPLATKAKTVASSEASSKEGSAGDINKGLGYIAMAICIAFACLGAGIAVAAAAPAAIGAVSEDKKSFGTSLVFVALAEGVTVFGLLIAIFIQNSISST